MQQAHRTSRHAWTWARNVGAEVGKIDSHYQVVRDTTALARLDGSGLTTREREVLQLVTELGATELVAEKLCISKHTVHHHLEHIHEKLNSASTVVCVARAMRIGLIV